MAAAFKRIGRTRQAQLALSLALLAAVAGFALLQRDAQAQAAADCSPCVMVLDVAGLEPEDVSPDLTPWLWGLAHPTASGESVQGPNPEVTSGRNGWIWQAPRSVMSAGRAANVASLLTGGAPGQHDIPADEYLTGDGAHVRMMDQQPATSEIEQLSAGTHNAADSIFNRIDEDLEGKKSAAFVGDPELFPLAGEEIEDTNLSWRPSEFQNSPGEASPGADNPPGLPAPGYCPLPRNLTDTDDYSRGGARRCVAPDIFTLDKAFRTLDARGDNVVFTYIHLAELGLLKELTGDFKDPSVSVTRRDALANLDTAVGQFLTRFALQGARTRELWQQTVVFVVGTHGYESTPQHNRLPNPGNAGEPTEDLTNYLEEDKGKIVPQGTMATVYLSKDQSQFPAGTPEERLARREELEEIRQDILDLNTASDSLCNLDAGLLGGGGCVKEVLFTDPAPDGDTTDTVAREHPSWYLEDHVDSDTKERTGTNGDLVIVTEEGWATGKIAPTLDEALSPELEHLTNYGTASYGGPRNRAVAALVNGDPQIVRQVRAPGGGGRYPVAAEPDTGQFNPNPRPKHAPTQGSPVDFDAVQAANADPADDANAPGHERQPETFDFLPTIAALLRVSVPSDQLHDESRFLQEAFNRQLGFISFEEDIGEALPDDPPPPQLPDIIGKAAPGFTFKGLMQRLRALVADRRGRVTRCLRNPRPQEYEKDCLRTKKRAGLSNIVVAADFGRPRTLVKLTFYRKLRRKGKRMFLRTTATFDPFPICRGPAQLNLKIPKLFKPTHIGVTVQEARHYPSKKARRQALKRARKDLIDKGKKGKQLPKGFQPLTRCGSTAKKKKSKKGKKPSKRPQLVPYFGVGGTDGRIVKLVDSHLLHREAKNKRSKSKKKSR